MIKVGLVSVYLVSEPAIEVPLVIRDTEQAGSRRIARLTHDNSCILPHEHAMRFKWAASCCLITEMPFATRPVPRLRSQAAACS